MFITQFDPIILLRYINQSIFMKNQHEWEGFQTINDHDEKTSHFINQPLNKIPESPTTKTRSKHHHRANFNQKKISRDKQPAPKDLPPSQASQILTKQDIQRQKIVQSPNNRKQLKEQQKNESKKTRFPPIPIIYEIPEYEHRGKLIYRGLLPKTADAYFRNLKDVKWGPVLDEKRISHGLQFNSRFQSGNLAMACQEYDLYMRVDTNTNGHMQWYYFSVKNSKKTRVRFNIYRFLKRYSLYQRGMRPYVRSRRSGKDWQPGGENVKYYIEKRINQNGVAVNSKYHYLTFTYAFQQENDEVFFAAGIPYTTTFLTCQIEHFQKLTMRNPNLKFEVAPLCTSLCGQQIELLTIEPKQDSKTTRKKQFIIINARSHSGESSASWVLDGLLDCLSDNQQVQQWMVNMNICFRIVPMLNKDGVFIGNYRTGVIGDDFNRRFKSGAREFFPEIFGLKKLISKCKKLGKVKLFLDLHGHSILKSSFIFGPDRKSFQSEQLINIGEYLLNNSKYFSHNSSVYCNEIKKIETARVYFQMQEEILSLTCQNSLGLYYDQYQTFQETSTDWRMFGHHIVQSIMNTLSCQGQSKCLQSQNKYTNKTEERTKSKIKHNLYWIRTGNKIKSTRNSPQSNTTSGQHTGVTKNIQQVTQKTDEEQEVSKPRAVRLTSQTGETNLTTPQRSIYGKAEKQREKQIKPPNLQSALQKSIILTRYANAPIDNGNYSEIIRNSKTADLNSSLNKKKQYPEEEQVIPDNFSEEYESINDSDEESEDLEPQKREELLQLIKQINIRSSEERVHSDHNASVQLQSIKGFKQYKINFQSQIHTEILDKRPIANKLKPLKYQEFKLRGFTEKKIKSNLELFKNMASDRMEARMLINSNPGNDFRCKKSKQLKRDEIMKKMFPDREEGEYLLMRIKEMKLENTRNEP